MAWQLASLGGSSLTISRLKICITLLTLHLNRRKVVASDGGSNVFVDYNSRRKYHDLNADLRQAPVVLQATSTRQSGAL
jgi:hypothetical protein